MRLSRFLVGVRVPGAMYTVIGAKPFTRWVCVYDLADPEQAD